MGSKKQDGTWVEPFDPTKLDHQGGEYTEGNAWQWTWLVPQELPGLMDLHGGRDDFAKKLNELFTMSSAQTCAGHDDVIGLIGQYAHGNEPSLHIAYLFNCAEELWSTDELLYKIMTEFYPVSPAGLIGNEDCGQMFAWFVLSALGIYQ